MKKESLYISEDNKKRITDPNALNIIFYVGDKKAIRLEPNGDIYVHEKLAENDLDVVNGLRYFLCESRKASR